MSIRILKRICLIFKMITIHLIWRIITGLVFKLKMEELITQRRRNTIGKKVYLFYNGKVAYGLFQGLTIPEQSAWSGSMDTGPKILGTYEKQVQLWISERNFKSIVFLHIGAADGYFALGLITSKIAKLTIAYEISHKDRNAINSLSVQNGISNKIELKGEATTSSIIDELKNSKIDLILIDIEGGEYELVNRELLFAAQNSFLIIEIHRYGTRHSLAEFRALCETFHKVEELNDFEKKIPRDIFTENLTDNERMLLLSEGRAYAMTWFALSPRS